MTNRAGGNVLPASEVKITLGDEQIELHVGMEFGLGGDQWPAATCFCHLITNRKTFYEEKVFSKDCRVLELGSGTGLGGIAVAKLFPGPRSIVISDLDQYTALIDRNIKLNRVEKQCTAQVIDWLNPPAQHTTYDVVLALECVYREDLYGPLLQMLKVSAHANTIIFLGLTRLFAQARFFTLLEEHGFSYKKIPHIAIPVFTNATNDTAIFIVWRVAEGSL